MADRAIIVKWWTEAWAEGLWAASWSKSLEGLTAQQAAWQPPAAPGAGVGPRHSIWQIVEHMIFWRETWLKRIDGGPRQVPKDELAAKNFPEHSHRSQTAEDRMLMDAAWAATCLHFRETQDQVAAALRTRGPEADPMTYFLPHDSYHFGQVNYLRAMLGLKAIE